MRNKNKKYELLIKFFLISLLIILVFASILISSSYYTLEYKIHNLEKKKNELVKMRKILLAERASLISAERFGNFVAGGFIYPNRVRVTYVKDIKKDKIYRASFKEN
jgi:Na+-transporting NADH:ubiquinone oxidoreductase subunit NqrC